MLLWQPERSRTCVFGAWRVFVENLDDFIKCYNFTGNFATIPYAMQLECASMLLGGEFFANEL